MAEPEPCPEVVAEPRYETVPGVVAELGETVEVATAPGSVAKPEAVENPSVCLTEAVVTASACPTGSPGPGALGTESPGPCSPVSCFLDLVALCQVELDLVFMYQVCSKPAFLYQVSHDQIWWFCIKFWEHGLAPSMSS